MTIIYQPKGDGTEHKEGTLIIMAPAGAKTSATPADAGWGGANYRMDNWVSNLPTTGEINAKYDGRFTGCDICAFE